MKIVEVNCETGVETIREATAVEIADAKARVIRLAELEAESESKAAAKAALLNKLGITAEEAQLLLGGN